MYKQSDYIIKSQSESMHPMHTLTRILFMRRPSNFQPADSKQHTNGTFGEEAYFKCKAGHGIFVVPSKVTVSKKKQQPASSTKSATGRSRPTTPSGGKASTAVVVTLDRSGGKAVGCSFMASDRTLTP